MLSQLHDRLNLANSTDASFWATCLVAFYGMFRKSHLLPMAPHLFDPRKQLTKADFKIFPWGTLITIRWSFPVLLTFLPLEAILLPLFLRQHPLKRISVYFNRPILFF